MTRSPDAADALIADLKSRTMMRLQISSDGLSFYMDAVMKHFRYGEADHAEVVKTYAASSPQPGMNPNSAASRYSPGRLLSVEKRPTFGMPFTKYISTSYMLTPPAWIEETHDHDRQGNQNHENTDYDV